MTKDSGSRRCGLRLSMPAPCGCSCTRASSGSRSRVTCRDSCGETVVLRGSIPILVSVKATCSRSLVFTLLDYAHKMRAVLFPQRLRCNWSTSDGMSGWFRSIKFRHPKVIDGTSEMLCITRLVSGHAWHLKPYAIM